MISAEFFDIFGFLGFLVILWIGTSLLKVAKKRSILLIVIGLIGAIVDGYIIVTKFILRG